jgi:hypothetical protein
MRMDDLLDKPNKKPKISIPRAKLFLRARLGWLWGYPQYKTAQWSWQAWYYPQPWEQHNFTPSEQDLAQAAYAYSRLIANFPKALPEIVGDVAVWREQVSRKLKAIRQLLDGQTVEPWSALLVPAQHQRLLRRVQHLTQQYPDLRLLLEQFMWWLSLDLTAVYAAVAWIEDEAANLSRLMQISDYATDTALHLFALTQKIPKAKVRRLLLIILNPIWQADDITYYKNIFQQYFTYWQKINANSELREINIEHTHKSVSALNRWQQWLAALLLKTPKQRKLELDAVTDLLSPELLADWQAWHELSREFVQTYERKRQSLVKMALWQNKSCPIEKARYLDLKMELLSYVRACSPNLIFNTPCLFLNMQQLFNLINSLHQQPFYLECLNSLNKQLARLPSTHIFREPSTPLLFLWHWQKLVETASNTDAYVRQTLKHCLHYLQSARTPEQLTIRLQPWLGLMTFAAEYHHWRAYKSPEAELIYNDDAVNSALFFQNLAQLAERAPDLMAEQVAVFYDFYVATPTTWPQLDYFLALKRHQLHLNTEVTDATVLTRLLGDERSPEQFVQLIETWQLAREQQAFPETKQLQALNIASWLQYYGYTDLVDLLKPAFAWDTVQSLSEQQRLLSLQAQTLPRPVLSSTADVSFIQTYPLALHPSLQRLARYHPAAASVAKRILQLQFPEAAQIEQEIAVLAAKLAQQPAAHLQQRLANLRARLHNPLPVSTQRLQHLAQKLDYAALHSVLTQWQAQCQQQLVQHLTQVLGIQQFAPAWLTDTKALTTLSSLTRLAAWARKLAARLLQAELQGAYPLIHEPANRKWLENMQIQGFNTAAWLQSFSLTTRVMDGEKSLILHCRFADKVMDILQMGDHFNTCLSYDGCNFFSTLSNAADINKRVLFAYNAQAEVVGRCLFVISDTGQLLHFRPYSHLRQGVFEQAIEQVLTVLEQRLGIQRAKNGQISTLVAQHWYNDGIATLMQTTPALAEGSHFQQLLKQKPVAIHTVWDCLQAHFAPQALSALHVLQAIEVAIALEHVESAFNLAYYAKQQAICSHMHFTPYYRLFVNSAAVDAEKLWELSQAWVMQELQLTLNQHDFIQTDIMGFFINRRPIKALQWLRLLKRKRYYANSAWFQASLVYYQCLAYFQLKRPRKVLELALAYLKQVDLQAFSDELSELVEKCQQQLATANIKRD